jgi:hypothetical protein
VKGPSTSQLRISNNSGNENAAVSSKVAKYTFYAMPIFFGFAALHLLLHLLHGDLPLQRAWEIARFLGTHACDEDFGHHGAVRIQPRSDNSRQLYSILSLISLDATSNSGFGQMFRHSCNHGLLSFHWLLCRESGRPISRRYGCTLPSVTIALTGYVFYFCAYFLWGYPTSSTAVPRRIR